jgi:S1-C subfamily serine protease
MSKYVWGQLIKVINLSELKTRKDCIRFIVLNHLTSMKRFLAIILIVSISTKFVVGQSAKEIAKNCLPSSVSLILEDNFKQPISLGSGFIVEKGKIVTNLHVIEGAKYGYAIVNGSTEKHKIQGYIAVDKQNDLAILSVPTIAQNSLQLDSIRPDIGEKIYAIGNPKGLSGTISEGIVSGIRNLFDKELIQITAPISPGSSGGPVITNSGQVVGVAVGTLTSGQNLNFAIPSSIILRLMSKDNNSISALNISKGTTIPKTDKSEMDIKEGVVVRDFKYTLKDEGGFCLKSLSILNRLPYTIGINNAIFILYDKTGTPVDYNEFNNGYLRVGLIKPFMAKSVIFDGYSGFDCYRERVLGKENGEYLVVRILDFDIIDD